ncbi:MAG: sodium:solute symporter [Bacteroidota bacterium]
MDATTILLVIGAYFVLLFIISWWTGRNADEQTFFSANRNSPWYLVAFGMIGATLSGVTYISVPGQVGPGSWGYLQFVFGNFVGFLFISRVLLPLYYRLNLTSIYGYLDQRFGNSSYQTGAIFFLLSRVIGASFRLYLVAIVLQLAIFDELGIPFFVTVLIAIALIYIYTYRGGIKTVVWTDTLQTLFLLVGAGIAVYLIADQLNWGPGELISQISDSTYSQTFFWDFLPANNFFKQFLSGMAVTIVMVGLDQDMMQKNLTCRNLTEAQTNMYSFSGVFVLANIFFLSLGALLYIYGHEMEIVQATTNAEGKFQLLIQNIDTGIFEPRKQDELFTILSLDYLGGAAAIFFVLGVIAAAYSSADSALTALTTSFCVDLLKFEKRTDEALKKRQRQWVHLGFSAVLFFLILIFSWIGDDSVVTMLFRAAGYTYGPLLGLFLVGMYMPKVQPTDRWVPIVCVVAPLLTYAIQAISPSLTGYTFGFEILLLNGALTVLGLVLLPRQA